MYDYLIVGTGFAGSVMAERIATKLDKKVLIIDKRSHIGGNSYDYINDFGLLVHKYGPHYFRTNSKKIFDYLSNFTDWRFFEYRVRTFVNGKLFPFPINRDTLNKFFQINLKSEEEAKDFLREKRIKINNPKNSEEIVISKVGWEIYNQFFKNYTLKQWGLNPKELAPSVCARIPIRLNTDDRYFSDRFQAIPLNGYGKLFKNLLNHPNITLKLNSHYQQIENKINYRNLIYTGCIDEFFNYKYGKLPYRSLKFKYENYYKEFYQKWCQINYPNDYDYTRIVEIKHVTGQKFPRTTIVKEFPSEKGEPFYPIPREENQIIYNKYEKLAQKYKNIYFIGRLAQYRYFNMDQVINESLNLFTKLKNN